MQLQERNGRVYVSGLQRRRVSDLRSVLRLLREGDKRRIEAPTAANPFSSRGHAVFDVTLGRVVTKYATGQQHVAGPRLRLVDLAGSEQVINRSLRVSLQSVSLFGFSVCVGIAVCYKLRFGTLIGSCLYDVMLHAVRLSFAGGDDRR